MKESVISIRNAVIGSLYRAVLKPGFFHLDPEFVHDRMTHAGRVLGSTAPTRAITRGMFGYRHPMLRQSVAGIDFVNPVGLAAGFDKEGRLVNILPNVGFGFMEIGSVTGRPCPGNAKPRLWRLPKSRSLVVHYGLKSDGAEVVSARLRNVQPRFPLGMSIAKANLAACDDLTAGVADYVQAATKLTPLAAYVTVNISCPNTSGGEPFVRPENLEILLQALDPIVRGRPTFIKLPAYLTAEDIRNILAVARRHQITGFVCTNLTKDRNNPAIRDAYVPPRGGLSGKVVEQLANDTLAEVARQSQGQFVLIGVGGIFSAADAYKKIRLGASLVQLITGMIYRGPQLISEINSGLVQQLRRDGFKNISEAVGADLKKQPSMAGRG